MNLCFINPSRSRRPEIYGLAEHLPRKYDITILQPSDKRKTSDDFNLSENVHVKYVPSIFMPLSNSVVTVPIVQKWMRELSNIIRLNKCDLVHVCDYEYLTSIPPILVKRKYGNIPMVIVNDSLIGVENYSFGSSLMDLLSKTYTYTIGIKILYSYDKIILLYSKLAERAKKLGLPEEKIWIIPNGIDIKKMFDYGRRLDAESIKRKYEITEDEKIILYVGRLVKMKRVEIVIEVIKKLLSENLKVKGLIVGDGPQRAKLEKIAGAMHHHVRFTGYLLEERFECYRIADLLILPSLSEGLPTVLLEAASFGLPTVATNANGIPDIIIHGKTGFLVNKWDYNGYASFAQLILTDDDMATKMGETAKKHVQESFSWNIIAKRYEKVYEDLLD